MQSSLLDLFEPAATWVCRKQRLYLEHAVDQRMVDEHRLTFVSFAALLPVTGRLGVVLACTRAYQLHESCCSIVSDGFEDWGIQSLDCEPNLSPHQSRTPRSAFTSA